MNTLLVSKAREFSIKAHNGLFRKNKAHDPYSVHLEEVAILVEQSGGSPEEIAAAWLHDAVEDTDVTLEEIRKQFGDAVADIVDGLTDPLEYKGMPTLERKTLQSKRIHTKSDSIKRVK